MMSSGMSLLGRRWARPSPRRVSGAGLSLAVAALLSGCGGIGTHSSTLAEAASTTRVALEVRDDAIEVTLEPTAHQSSCLRVDANATLAGLPMRVVSPGSSHVGTGTGPGSVHNQCTPPAFELSRSDKLPSLDGPVALEIRDNTATYRVQVSDALATRKPALTAPADGTLHSGGQATIDLGLQSESIDSAMLVATSSTGEELFRLGQPTGVDISDNTIKFVAPTDVKPQNLRVEVNATLVLVTSGCKGPSACSARRVIGFDTKPPAISTALVN
jgi:hypothetical protein